MSFGEYSINSGAGESLYPCYVAVLSIRAGSRPKQPATGQSSAGYSSHFTVNFGKKLKIRKRSNKNNCETSASNV